MKRLMLVLLLSAMVVGCGDQRTATSPPGAAALPGGISAAISDGNHQVGGVWGNADFFFRPPLVPNPVSSPNFSPGKFNPRLKPVVRVFALPGGGDDGCTFTSAETYGPVVAPANAGEEQYQINWNTRASQLVPGTIYRICVFGSNEGTLLGYLDVEPIPGGMKNARLQDEIYLFQDDRTLPIKFRIEEGALSNLSGGRVGTEFTVPAGGGVVTLTHLDTALAAVFVPSDALQDPTDQVTIVIAQELPQYEGQCVLETGLVQSDWCYQIRTEPAGYEFKKLVRVEICVDPTPLEPEQDPDDLRVFKHNETGLVELPWEDPTLIGDDCKGPTPQLGAAFPSLRGILGSVGQWASRLFTPSDLMASVFATPPKGLGGSTTTFSDFGGAIPALEPQTIIFPEPATPKVYGSMFAVEPEATSGLPVTVAATGGCSIAEGMVLMTSGTTSCVLTASQPGNGSYAAAPDVVRTVAASPAAQTIVFGALADKTMGDPPFTVSATGGASGNPVTFDAGPVSVCTVSLTTVTLTGTGTCTVTASQAGNTNYAAAADVPQAFEVAAAAIDFESLPNGAHPVAGPLTDQFSVWGVLFGAGVDAVMIADWAMYREAGATGTWAAWYGHGSQWWFTFTAAPGEVVFDGYGNQSTEVTIRAYDGSGVLIPSTSITTTAEVPYTTVNGYPFYKRTRRIVSESGVSKVEIDQRYCGCGYMVDNIRY